jgi:NADPH-dependent ferric siderophore reductase
MSSITEYSAEHNAAACRASRHTRVQHLITADESSLVELEVLLATLPICSTGRVFIEVPDASWFSGTGQAELAVPSRMVVTWLDRAARTGMPGSGRSCAPGQALARAVTACDHLTTRSGVAADAIHTPERFGLATAR